VAEPPLRVVVAAEESAGVQALERLSSLRPAVEVVAVLTSTQPDAVRRPLAAEAGRRLGLDTDEADLVRSPEFAARLRREAVDLLVNVHSLFIVHPDVLAAPRIGCFNLHPGPLPEYAGLNAPSWAIYNGEPTHAVTLHWMDEAIDAGPIAWIERFEVNDGDTGISVSGKCVRHGVPLIGKLVGAALEDPATIPRIAQDRSRRRYHSPGPPDDGLLDWSRPAAEISRFVRAADYAPFTSPWGHPTSVLDGRRIGIARVKLTGSPASGPPGAIDAVTDAGALVSALDELVLVERVWVDGRYAKPAAVLGD
jgi:UDP-4-amino-4-deoxy-L-arabinose formyltransferase/UDP-glucuronic acid dehydrogenase (UDP-4-keto-hexauronic acid decarboxylating)